MRPAPRLAAALVAVWLLPAITAATGAGAAPQPKKPAIPWFVVVPPAPDSAAAAAADRDTTLDGLPRTYGAMVRRFAAMSPADSMGNGDFRAAEAEFAAGKFDEAGKAYADFARRYPRNLNVNEALSTVLLIRDARDFEEKPLGLYARARLQRHEGRVDSAVATLTAASERYPGARVRHHVHLMLAEIARERQDHATALRWALAAADTTAKNRLAPLALQIAAESSLDLGEPPQKALAYYKVILERYPQSAVTPEARTRALEIRKRMPQ